MDKLRNTDLDEKKGIRDDLTSTDDRLNKLTSTYETFTGEATKLDEVACKGLFDQCMTALLDSRGKNGGDGEVERQKMRLYSFTQLLNIINKVCNNSDMSDRMKAAEDNI